MSDEIQNTDAESVEMPVDEIEVLKQRADMLGIKYSPRIGVDSLREKINAALKDEKPSEEEADPEKMSKKDLEIAIRQKQRKEELKLIRLRITNMNPNKRDLRGEIFTVANRYLGIVKKFIPYGEATEDGYHVPNIIYKQLKDRKFLDIRTRRDRQSGQIIVEQNWVPEFALEVLPQLTQEELDALAKSQAAKAGL